MQGLMNVVGATMRPQIYVFSSTVLILATEGAFFCALSHLISNFLSASIALTASTRPPFDLYIYALQEKWTVEHVSKTFWRIQERKTPRASKSHIFLKLCGFAIFSHLPPAYFIQYD